MTRKMIVVKMGRLTDPWAIFINGFPFEKDGLHFESGVHLIYFLIFGSEVR